MKVQYEGSSIHTFYEIIRVSFFSIRKPKLPKCLIFDRRVLPQSLSSDEKLKHQYFTQRYHDEVMF